MVKNIAIRALSGTVYVALIVAAIVLLDQSPLSYLVLFSAMTVLGIKEVYNMLGTDEAESWLIVLIDMLGGVGILLSVYMGMTGGVWPRVWLPWCVCICWLAVWYSSTVRTSMPCAAWSVRSLRCAMWLCRCRCWAASSL